MSLCHAVLPYFSLLVGLKSSEEGGVSMSVDYLSSLDQRKQNKLSWGFLSYSRSTLLVFHGVSFASGCAATCRYHVQGSRLTPQTGTLTSLHPLECPLFPTYTSHPLHTHSYTFTYCHPSTSLFSPLLPCFFSYTLE